MYITYLEHLEDCHSIFIQSFYHQQPNHLIYRVLESKAPDFSCSQVLIAIDRHAKDYASIHSFLHTYFISQLFQSIFRMQQTAAIKYE